MNPADMFVGLVAIGLGAIYVVVAAVNWEWYFQLRKARWLEARLGRTGVRCIYALLGVGLISLGLAITMGFSPNSSKSGRNFEFRTRQVQV